MPFLVIFLNCKDQFENSIKEGGIILKKSPAKWILQLKGQPKNPFFFLTSSALQASNPIVSSLQHRRKEKIKTKTLNKNSTVFQRPLRNFHIFNEYKSSQIRPRRPKQCAIGLNAIRKLGKIHCRRHQRATLLAH